MATTSKVDICNLALDCVGEGPITSIDSPTTKPEHICKRWYDQLRQELLREYVWNFAKERTTLARSGDADFDYGDAYALPADFIRFISCGGDYEVDHRRIYDIQGNEIILDNDGGNSLKLRYIKNETNVTNFDPLFIEMLYLRMAIILAQKLPKKNSYYERLTDAYARAESKAISIDGQERPPQRVERSHWRTMRNRGASVGIASPYTVID